jgi:hypothetical protein
MELDYNTPALDEMSGRNMTAGREPNAPDDDQDGY